MEIYTLNPSTIAYGEEAFRDCIRQYLGSSYSSRDDGTAVIPGAIAAVIRAGITDECEITRIVARVSRCRETTVSKVLHGLADDQITGRLWARDATGAFYPKRNANRAPAAVMIN